MTALCLVPGCARRADTLPDGRPRMLCRECRERAGK